MEGYWPRPQPRARRSAGERANSDCGDLEVGNFAPFSEILHIKCRNFLDVFYISVQVYL